MLCKLNLVFLLTKQRKWYCVKLSTSKFDCYTHIFATFSFWFKKKVLEIIMVLLKSFEQYFLHQTL